MEKELPNNWSEIELGSILKLKNGYAFKSEDFRDKGVPVIRISNIQNEQVLTEDAARIDISKIKQEFVIKQGDILIAMSGATTGKYGIYNEDVVAVQNQRVGNLVPHDERFTSRKFILYLLGNLKKEIEDKAYGGAQPNISPKIIEEIIIGLPPLPEQQRIVAKLDTLFGHLNAMKTRLERIPQLLKEFRQKVLTQAVTGKLTEEWREGQELEEWGTEALGNLLLDVKYGTSKKSDYETNGIPILRIPNIKEGEIDISDLKYSILDDKEYESLSLDKGDILIIRSNGSVSLVGQCAIVRDNLKGFSFAGYLIRLRVKDLLFPDYLNYALESHSLREQIVEKAKSTSGVNNINSQEIKDLIINYPPVIEQQEIVRRVETLFAKADQIEAGYQKLKAKIDQLPQALLAKAFRGELVPQLPTDGDARELLEEIKKAKGGK